jgi:hypothetical protein
MDETARSTGDASNKDPAKFPYTKTTGIAGVAMAKAADMEIEIKQSERIALIDSAVWLVSIFSSRPATISGEPSMTESELEFYQSALAFLQMQYELEKPVVVIRTPKEPA